ncbi:mannose-ethanolamine phosphotransferase gpi [Salix suchowensis]|nr:mannose-ethanolamine phosphotransferase gpi [Salix suchowensis]
MTASAAWIWSGSNLPRFWVPGALPAIHKVTPRCIVFRHDINLAPALWYTVPTCLDVSDEANADDPKIVSTSGPKKRKIRVIGFGNAFGSPYLLSGLLRDWPPSNHFVYPMEICLRAHEGSGVPICPDDSHSQFPRTTDARRGLGTSRGSMESLTFDKTTIPKQGPYRVGVRRESVLAGLGVMIYYGSLLLGTAVSAAILRRHLMVWKVFAPRFMLGALSVVVVDLGVLLGVGLGVAGSQASRGDVRSRSPSS